MLKTLNPQTFNPGWQSTYLRDIGSMDRALRIAGGRDGPQTGGGAISVSEVVSHAKSSPGRGGGEGGGGGIYYLPVVEPLSSLLSDEVRKQTLQV